MKSNKFILIFLSKTILLYLIWFITYDLWLKKVGDLDNLILDNLVYLSFEILFFFNFNTNLDFHTISIVDSTVTVFVGSGCNGLELFALFTGFVIAFKGSWINKMWFIPAGIFIIHFFNIMRIISLILIGRFSPLWLDFNHKYTFTIVLYCLTFLLWMLWVKYFSITKKEEVVHE
jgi:exosortase/archaeosortase family protein